MRYIPLQKKYYTGEQIKDVLDEFCQADYDEVLGMLNRFACLETEDVEPIRHGRWIWDEPYYMFCCSICGNHAIRNDYPYCMWCGASMSEVSE